MRTVPDVASHEQDDTGSNPTVALMHMSLFKGDILENLLEKTANRSDYVHEKESQREMPR
jgi:hypothetical protein